MAFLFLFLFFITGSVYTYEWTCIYMYHSMYVEVMKLFLELVFPLSCGFWVLNSVCQVCGKSTFIFWAILFMALPFTFQKSKNPGLLPDHINNGTEPIRCILKYMHYVVGKKVIELISREPSLGLKQNSLSELKLLVTPTELFHHFEWQ